MTTIIAIKPLVGAVAACAACLEKDPLHHHPGRMRITRSADALTLATATRTEKVRIKFRIPCEPGETWVAVVDADGASRLARALRPLTGGKRNGHDTVEIDRAERSLVLAGGGQRISIPACDPMLDESAPVAGEVTDVVGASDLSCRIAEAMAFSNPAGYQAIAKGPFAYFVAADGGLTVPAVVATDGHRLFVDGDARDCADTKLVVQVSGDDWKPAGRALAGKFDAVRLVRVPLPKPTDEEGSEQKQRFAMRLVFDAADRRVEIAAEEPQTSLPPWAGFIPRETEGADLSVTCDRAELVAAVRTVAAIGRQKNAACMFRGLVDQGILRICASTDYDGGIVQREIPAAIRHAPEGYVHLNGKYVLDALSVVRTEKVRLLQRCTPLDAVRLIEVVPEGSELRLRGIVTMPIRGRDPVENVEGSESTTDEAPAVRANDATTGAAVPAEAATA